MRALVTRHLLLAALAAALLHPLLASGQGASPAPARVGILIFGPVASARNPYVDAFRDGLRQLGYVEGRNLVIELRGADNDYARLAAAAAELVRQNVQLIFVNGPTLARSVQSVNQRIPVVCWSCGDPVENGVAVSLARPGRNVTGLASLSAELMQKRVELVRELIPEAARVGVITFPANPGTAPTLKALEEVSRKLRIEVVRFEMKAAGEFEKAFKDAHGAKLAALIVQDDIILFDARQRIAQLGVTYRLPVIVGLSDLVEAGALLGYSPERIGMARRAAVFADRILKGANPADMPFEQASQFELIVNKKTANAIGVTIPRALLLRADRIVE
jgi:putative ABC transport system substrate-binding protein